MELESIMLADLVEDGKYRIVVHSLGGQVWDGVFVRCKTIRTHGDRKSRYVFKATTPQVFTSASGVVKLDTFSGLVSINKIVENKIVAKWKERTLGLVLKGLVDDNFECNYLETSDKGRMIQMICYMKTYNELFLSLEPHCAFSIPYEHPL